MHDTVHAVPPVAPDGVMDGPVLACCSTMVSWHSGRVALRRGSTPPSISGGGGHVRDRVRTVDRVLAASACLWGKRMTTIRFYSTREEYGCFSNFSRHPFELDGKRWPTSEHYFQAQKFAGTAHAETIRQARTPKEAAELGRDRRHPLRPNWEKVKDDVMRRAVLRKFETHADIQATLLSTDDAVLVEQTTGDYYWGCGADGTGQNKLGRILMEVRERLRRSAATPEPPPRAPG